MPFVRPSSHPPTLPIEQRFVSIKLNSSLPARIPCILLCYAEFKTGLQRASKSLMSDDRLLHAQLLHRVNLESLGCPLN